MISRVSGPSRFVGAGLSLRVSQIATHFVVGVGLFCGQSFTLDWLALRASLQYSGVGVSLRLLGLSTSSSAVLHLLVGFWFERPG